MDLDGFMLSEEEVVGSRTEPRCYETEEIRKERAKDQAGRRGLRVLIAVKTTPQPSEKYDDTVCVAGVALDGPLRWVRLYPIPFRHLPAGSQFKKYAIITVDVSRSPHDPRFESLRVNAESIRTIEVLGTVDGWKRRAEYIERIGEVDLCDLQTGIDLDRNGPSLGLVRPKHGTFRLSIAPHPGWTPTQRAKLLDQASRQRLPMDEVDRSGLPLDLEPPPLKIWTLFKCEAEGCSGHRIGLLDWEATAIQRQSRGKSDEHLESILREKLEDNVLKPEKDLRIYVGNQADPTKRRSFEALGLYYPTKRASELAQAMLFL